MLISELIKKLQDFKDLNGDIQVKTWPYDGQSNPHLVQDVDIVSEKIIGVNQSGQPENYWITEPCEPYIIIE